jgi:hypothetical protein
VQGVRGGAWHQRPVLRRVSGRTRHCRAVPRGKRGGVGLAAVGAVSVAAVRAVVGAVGAVRAGVRLRCRSYGGVRRGVLTRRRSRRWVPGPVCRSFPRMAGLGRGGLPFAVGVVVVVRAGVRPRCRSYGGVRRRALLPRHYRRWAPEPVCRSFPQMAGLGRGGPPPAPCGRAGYRVPFQQAVLRRVSTRSWGRRGRMFPGPGRAAVRGRHRGRGLVTWADAPLRTWPELPVPWRLLPGRPRRRRRACPARRRPGPAVTPHARRCPYGPARCCVPPGCSRRTPSP